MWKQEDIKDVADDLNSMFDEEIPKKEVFRLSDQEKIEINKNVKVELKTPQSKTTKIINWIDKHVSPDVSLAPFRDSESPDFKNDDLDKITEKMKKNLRVGLKISWTF